MPWTASPYAVGQPAGQLGWRAPFSTVLITPSMVAVATMLSPTVLVGFIITPPAMAGVAVFRPPTVTSTAALTVPPMQATAVLLTPFLGTVIPVAVPVLPATAQFRTPTVAAGASVASPLMQALAALLAPAVSTAYAELPPTMTAAALMPAPAVASGVGVAPPLMLAAAALLTPTVTIGGPILPPPMAALAVMPTPAVSSSIAIGGGVTIPAFDAVGGTGSTTLGSTASETHTGTAGATILGIVETGSATITSLTFGGITMPLVGSIPLNNAASLLAIYQLTNAPGGAQTVTATMPGSPGAFTFTTVGYTGVNAVSPIVTVYGTGSSLSQSATDSANQIIVQAFGSHTGGATWTALGGGTTVRLNAAHLAIQESGSSTTFTATSNNPDIWAGAYVVLSGGVGGAPLMAASAAMPAPTVAATAAVTIPAPLLAAAAAMLAPTVNVGVGVAITAPLLHATAAMPTPTVNVTAPAPTYDAVGAGNSGGSVSSLTWSHTAAAGATVIAVISTNDSGSSAVKYGSSTMTKLTPSSAADGSGYTTYFYKLSGAPGGTQTVTVTPSAAADVVGNTISVTGVTSVGAPAAAANTTASASQAVTCTSSQLIIQSFAELGSDSAAGTSISATGGGTRRSLLALFGANCFSISTATATTTFTATFSGTASWVGLAVIFS
jgi:hypothetical protein